MRVAVSLCLFAAIYSAAVAAPGGASPFHSSWVPRQAVENYETFNPVIVYQDTTEPHPKELWARITTATLNITLKLELNEVLLPPHFKTTHFDEEGKEVITKGHVNCYYHGEVQGHPEWRVTMSTCHGLRGAFGDFSSKDQYYHVEPLDQNTTSVTMLGRQHVLYLDSELPQKPAVCGSDHTTHQHDTPHFPHLDPNMTAGIRERLRRQASGVKYVEWIIVNDNRIYRKYGRDLEAIVRRSISIANKVDMLFKKLNVRVVLVGVITWTQGDQISITSNPNQVLQNFRDYRPRIPTPHDSTALLTGIDFPGNTVGVAYIGAMCHETHSVVVVQDHSPSASSVGLTAAHELGHVLNMNHDDASSCNCPDGQRRCIMAAVSSNSATRWSQCSRTQLQQGFADRGLDRCLMNEPTMIVGDPVCGNGIREGNEVCDCGSPQECNDPCCDAMTCQLRSGAQCAAGPCCDNCQFRAYGTTCRSASNECDIAEYCPGDSSDCPTDDYRRDGTSCNNNRGYCFSGSCPSADDECRLSFGEDSGRGVDECFEQYNTRGDQFGNCGHTSTGFISCSSSDVMCGQLHCIPGDFVRPIQSSVRIATVSAYVPSLRGFEQCRSFTTLPGSDVMSPGLVDDGIKCGDGRLCVDQRCVSVAQLSRPNCPVGNNGHVCSGNGQCNNRGRCSCNVGFSGSSCQSSTSGPGATAPPTTATTATTAPPTTPPTTVTTPPTTATTQPTTQAPTQPPTTQPPSCGGTLQGDSGSFNSPGWPEFYPVDTDCEWTIVLASTNKVIRFTYDDSEYGLAGRDPCPKDYVEIFDGLADENAPSLGKSCFRETPPPVVTSASQATVRFHAGPSHGSARRGFRLTFEAVDNPQDVNECNTNNGGCAHTCINTEGSFRCICRLGYRLLSDGRSCADVNECNTNNGGCAQTCTNTQGSFNCSCRSGYRLLSDSRSCSDINECTEGTHNCDQVCTNTLGSFQCSCRSGYRLLSNDRSCTDVNECNTNNGGCAHICINTQGSFQCPCRSGYRQNSDGRSCTDINECDANNGGCAHNCTNTQGSFNCSCRSGYRLLSDSRSCSDINECTEGTHNCDQLCTNMQGSFRCSCRSSFTLASDGRTCTPVTTPPTTATTQPTTRAPTTQPTTQTPTTQAPTQPPSCGGTLQGDSGSFNSPGWPEFYPVNTDCEWTIVCTNTSKVIKYTFDDREYGLAGKPPCPKDYCEIFDGLADENAPSLGKSCYKTTPPPVVTSTHQATVRFHAGPSHNPTGRRGFRLTCECIDNPQGDINECNTNNGGCDQTCTNTQGSFQCSCRSGYGLLSDGRSCTDINECNSNNGGCTQICTDNPGSFQCSCNAGFQLGSGGSCNDINECNTNNGGCEGNCVNTEGSFLCGCSAGFQLGSDGSCSDINECNTNNGGCEQNCFNTLGSFRCGCNPGFRLANNGRSCNDIDECSEGSSNCEQLCSNNEGSFRCSCNSGYSLASDSHSCNDINECTEGTHNCDQLCTNLQGSFRCSCRSGFTLASDGRTCTQVTTPPTTATTQPPTTQAPTTHAPSCGGCGGTLRGDSGCCNSPGWPEFYPVDTDCEWNIVLTSTNKVIRFTFDDREYGLAGKPPCPKDYVEIFDGLADENAPSLGKSCFRETPPPVMTSTHRATVRFHAGPSHSHTGRRGFRLNFEAVDRP